MKESRRPARKRQSLGKDLRSVQIGVLSSMPGISTVLAERMMDHFGSLEHVFSATLEQLMEVEGVGKVKAREIRSLISAESVPSG